MDDQVRLNRVVGLVCAISLGICSDSRAQNQSAFDLAGQLVMARIGQLDVTDIGVSGRVAWRPSPIVGIEAELGVFPADAPRRVALTSSRVEIAVGATAGRVIGRLRPFASLRTGAVRFAEAPQPVACILIFPPPLSCQIAAGYSGWMLELGGGVEINVSPRNFLRVDVGDRMIRYPGPSFNRDREIHDSAFFGHDLRVAVGSGWRF